jgi:ABC-type multidrug transport system permease subunit
MAENKNSEHEEEKFIDFAKIRAIIKKNFTVITRDRIRLLPLIMFPLVMIFIFGYTTGNIPRHISTAVVDYDTSGISQNILQQINSNNVFSVKYMVSTEGEGKKLLDSGKIRVIIIIPKNLEEDIVSGKQSGVTIIVDESDSSVAATAKQSLSQIVNAMSDQISKGKIRQFQDSVSMSAIQLEKNTVQIDAYPIINSRLESAYLALSEAKKISDKTRDSIQDSLPDANLYLPESPNNVNNTVNTNYFYVQYPLGYSATKAQLALFTRTSALLDIASRNLQAASILSSESEKKIESLNEYQNYQKNIVQPMNRIMLFTKSSPDAVIQPLLYNEKPAYGTGKRAIDFTIAAIIALTIFQGAVMGMGRAIAGEKREGSLTRVFLTPTSNATIIAGTLSFYILFELFRSAFILSIAVLLFHVNIEGSFLTIGLILTIYAGVSTSIGMILSSMVKTEQQFMAMAMLVSMPTTFLSGAFFPLQAMPKFLQVLSQFLPVTYGAEALRGVMIKGFPLTMILVPLFVLVVFLAASLTLVFMIFKRDIE